jgi:AcrR family transcriptional regulator
VAKDGIEMTEGQPWGAPRRGKRARLRGDELREKVLTTAVEELEANGGLSVSLDHLNVEQLIRTANVPRSSFYRLWETKEAFYVELMERMIEQVKDQGAAWDQETLDIAQDVIERFKERLDSEDGRRAVLEEAVRRGAQQNFEAVSKSLSWRTSTALSATLQTLEGEDHDHIVEVLERTEQRFVDRMMDFYDQVLPVLGLRMKAPFDTKTLAVAGSSVVEGLIGRQLANQKIVDEPIRLPGIDGEPVDWHLAAVGFLAIVDAMTEPDPNWRQSLTASANPLVQPVPADSADAYLKEAPPSR